MDYIIVTSKNNNNNNDKKKEKNNPKYCNIQFRRGLKIGCINVRGIVSNVNKRIQLNYWIELNDLDVVCIQEWFIPHNKQTVFESKRNKKYENDNKDDELDYDSESNSDNLSEYVKENFGNEKLMIENI